MNTIGRLWHRMLVLLRGARFDRELQEEMQQHLEWRVRDAVEAGMAPEAARRAAAHRLGLSLIHI